MLPCKINHFFISEIMKKVNSKYVELLSEAFEKYRNIEVIEKTVTKCYDNDEILDNIPKIQPRQANMAHRTYGFISGK